MTEPPVPGGVPALRRGVGIVMRTRDRPLLLRRALRSVIAQDFPHWHLYLVNDGGEAGAVDGVLAAFAPAFEGRLTLTHNRPGLGRQFALNQGIGQVREECFALHDDDDTWQPGFLSATVGLLDAPGHANHVGAVTAWVTVFERIEADRIVVEREAPAPDLGVMTDLARLLVRNETPPIALVFRTWLIAEVGAFDPALPVLEDWDFYLRAMLRGDVAAVPAHLANYHLRQGGQDAYGNTVIAEREVHDAHRLRLRNAAVRRALAGDPAMAGLLQPLLQAVERMQDTVIASVRQDLVTLMREQQKHSELVLTQLVKLIVEQGHANAARVEQGVRAMLRPAPAGLDVRPVPVAAS